jgi:hypothetical protein
MLPLARVSINVRIGGGGWHATDNPSGRFIQWDVPTHIEDTVVVTAIGYDNLNGFTHDIVVV